MKKEDLLARYEALGDERDFAVAQALYEQAVSENSNARVLADYGYLLESHGRNELRRAIELYERAIDLDPSYDRAHYQLISARAGLQEPELPVAIYEQRVADSPGEVREQRFLAIAYLKTHDYRRALAAAGDGLALAPNDPPLIALRGEARAGLGDPEGALADWRCALALDADDISALYSSAFLLERLGRLTEATQAWESIIEWGERHGDTLHNEWPKQELARLRALRKAPGRSR
ncbi:MAG: tetratricopeptide repeat protein [Solirubrobacterales bacterium]|nr:tetratricopeptide repeat protein [Solirubrobacterales bacterium]MBV9534846.1 tetratricopeptide repeat protein [Solirubrobacterales bacterium]